MTDQVRDGVRKSMEPWLKDHVQFYEHQIEGVRTMMRMRSFLLCDDMGLGKSLQAITVSVGDVIRGWAEKILVVAPTTLKGNWSDEFDKFTGIPHIIFGQGLHPKDPERLRTLTPMERKKQLDVFARMKGPRVLIANYEQINKHLYHLNNIGFDIIIFDEAHMMKNPKAQRTKACIELRANRHFLLTGTPMLNATHELWTLLHIADPVGFPNFFAFKNRYCAVQTKKVWVNRNGVRKQITVKTVTGVKNEPELRERLNRLMIRRVKEDVLDLPEVQYIKKRLDLLPAQQKIYDQISNELSVDMVGETDPMEIENALTEMLRLKQVCGTTLDFTGKDESAKLDQAVADAVEIIENGHRVVVFTQFRGVLEAFCRRLDEALPDTPIWELHGDVPQSARQGIVKEWTTNEEPGAIACMLQVAGVGLNMTAARHALFLDKWWTPGMNQQAVDRLHRIGQSSTQQVQVLEYLMRGTVETKVEDILTTKKNLFGMVVNEQDYKAKLLESLKKRG